MSTIQEIKDAIGKLPLEERAELVSDLCGWSDDEWDRQMKADTSAGKFRALNEDADAADRAGQTRSLLELTADDIALDDALSISAARDIANRQD